MPAKRPTLQRPLHHEILAPVTPGVEIAGAYLLPLAQIEANPWQPRQHADAERLAELMADIKQRGILQPIVVRPVGERRYQVVAGERRYRAATALGLETVPCIIREELDDEEARAISLVENLQREDLDIEDEARFLQALHDQGMSLRDIGAAIHKSYQYVNRRLKLLEDPAALRAYRQGQLNLNDLIAGHVVPAADVPMNAVATAAQAAMAATDGTAVTPGNNGTHLPDGEAELSGSNGSADPATQAPRNRPGTFNRRSAAFKPFQKLEVYVDQIRSAEIPPEDRDPLRLTITNLIEKLAQLQAQLEGTTEGETSARADRA